MPLTLQNLRDELREHLGVGTELDNTAVDLLINRAWWEVQSKFKFREKEISVDIATVDGTKEYDIEHEAIQRVVLIDDDDEYHQLKQLSLDEAIQGSTDDTSHEAQPTHYFIRNRSLELYPTPDAIYTLRVFCQETLDDVISDGPPIPQEWHEIILYGAVQRGHARYGNINKAAAFASMQASLVASAIPVEVKELEDSRFAQAQVLRPRYP